MDIGSKVITEFGEGKIIGRDLPEDIEDRFVVHIPKPNKRYGSRDSLFPDRNLCFMKDELVEIKDKNAIRR